MKVDYLLDSELFLVTRKSRIEIDVWEFFRLLRDLTYTKRGDDSEREEDMRSAGIEDD